MDITTGSGLRAWLVSLRDLAAGRRGRWGQALLWTGVSLIALRLLAPLLLTCIANAALADGKTVRGSIDGLSLGLLGCTYTVHGLRLRIRHQDDSWLPLLDIARLRCDLAWGPLLHGDQVGEATASDAVLYVFAPVAAREPLLAEPQTAAIETATAHDPLPEAAWAAQLRTVVRARLTAVTIINGTVRYRDERHDFVGEVSGIAARVDDLTIPQPSLTHRSPFHLTARTPGQGVLQIDGEADLLARSPTFLARARLEGVRLVELNSITKHIDHLTFVDGTFDGYAEVVGDGRRLGGYLKVLFHHLEVGSFGTAANGNGTSAFWTAAVALAEDVLENTALHQHAARVPLAGALGDPSADVWSALGSALANAFIRALAPGFDRMP